MAFKIALILALVAQVLAALLALRLNNLYRAQRAWLFVSGAAILMALLRLTSLYDVWDRTGDVRDDMVLWTLTLASLTISLLMLGGMALIEPLFRQIEEAQQILRQENRQLASAVEATAAEMQLARSIQQGLLPDAPPAIPGLDIAGASRPAEWTSGDYFDYFQLAGGDQGVLVADASGHGTGPALLMSTTRAAVRAFAASSDDVGQLMTSVNGALCEDISDNRFVTAFLIAFREESLQSHWVGAGHASWLCKRSGETIELAPDHPPLGVLNGREIRQRPLPELETGDILLLITDGILETQNVDDELLGPEAVLATVAQNREASAAEIVEAVFALADRFADGPQRDDNTVVIVKAV